MLKYYKFKPATLSNNLILLILPSERWKVKGHTTNCHEGTEDEIRDPHFSLDVTWVWVVNATPQPLVPRNDPVPIE